MYAKRFIAFATNFEDDPIRLTYHFLSDEYNLSFCTVTAIRPPYLVLPLSSNIYSVLSHKILLFSAASL